MTISGFTFTRNADKLYFPIRESIESILDLVDEFIVVLGNCDEDDSTRQTVSAINSSKIRIIESHWDLDRFPHNTVYAQQTDLAKQHCRGDWLFYLQNDEVIHEEDLPLIKAACSEYLSQRHIDGLLFEYLHFWGDYRHYHQAHNWYPREIRVIRNDATIHSWKDAQSFRKFTRFEGTSEDYLKKRDTSKLSVARIGARVFHYGWVRPPLVMTEKARIGNPYLVQKNWRGHRETIPDLFDYGPLNRLSVYQGSHPEVMRKRMASLDWADQLQEDGPRKERPLYKHERLKYRILSWIEYGFLGGRQIGGFRNYRIKA